MRMRKKKWVTPFLENENKYIIKKRQPLELGPKTVLEIGMGMGDFITQSAKNNPKIDYIGFEKVDLCIAHAVLKAQELELDNLRIIMDDAKNVDEYFDHNVDTLVLLFSDPWPKKRQYKRRLTYRDFIQKYEKILKDEGEIVFKSDNRQLFEFTLKEFSHFDFYLLDLSLDLELDENNPISNYEKRFREMGNPIYYAHFKKRVDKKTI